MSIFIRLSATLASGIDGGVAIIIASAIESQTEKIKPRVEQLNSTFKYWER